MQHDHLRMDKDQVRERIWQSVQERSRIEQKLKYYQCCKVHLSLKQDSFHFCKCANPEHNKLHNKRIEAILAMHFHSACLRTYE